MRRRGYVGLKVIPGAGLLIEVCASTATAGPGLPSILETRATSRLRLGLPTRIHTQLYRRLREEVSLGWTKRFHICTVDGDIPQLSTDTGNFNSRTSDRREERPGDAECRWEDDKAKEVLVLDSSTFIEEIGLMSRRGSALKHYLYRRGLYRRGTQLVVPAVVAEECERRLSSRAMGKRKQIQDGMEQLARYSGKLGGWAAPSDDVIEERVKALAAGDGLGAILLPETEDVGMGADLRDQAERPRSHGRGGLADCRIWEQCLDLLTKHEVVFVSADGDFCGYREPNELHPQLRDEAEAVGGGRGFTFHRKIEALLAELKSEIPPIPVGRLLAFIYDALDDMIQKLESNSGCRPRANGEVEETRLKTDQADVIEIRLVVRDTWESPDGVTVMDFYLSGSCHYHLDDERLADLDTGNVRLSTTQPDGSVRAVRGSYVNVNVHFSSGPRPVEPDPGTLT